MAGNIAKLLMHYGGCVNPNCCCGIVTELAAGSPRQGDRIENDSQSTHTSPALCFARGVRNESQPVLGQNPALSPGQAFSCLRNIPWTVRARTLLSATVSSSPLRSVPPQHGLASSYLITALTGPCWSSTSHARPWSRPQRLPYRSARISLRRSSSR